MTSPNDGDVFFTCPGEGDFILQERETHHPIPPEICTPPSCNCYPTVQWKETLMDVGTGTWHPAQDIHTAPLMPENHPTDSRTLVVQVKAQNPQGFAAIDQVRITLYKAQDRPRSEYNTAIEQAADEFGVDPTILKAILCHESYDKNDNWPVGTRWNQYAHRSRIDPNEYCNPLIGKNGHDWGIGQIYDETYTENRYAVDFSVSPPDTLFGPIKPQQYKYDPFYNTRLAAAKLKWNYRYIAARPNVFGTELTDEQKTMNAIVWYNAALTRRIWDKGNRKKSITELRKDKTKKKLFDYLDKVNHFVEQPCYTPP